METRNARRVLLSIVASVFAIGLFVQIGAAGGGKVYPMHLFRGACS